MRALVSLISIVVGLSACAPAHSDEDVRVTRAWAPDGTQCYVANKNEQVVGFSCVK